MGTKIVEQDETALAAALRELLAQPEALVKRGAAARKWALTEFDPAKSAERYEALYREAASLV